MKRPAIGVIIGAIVGQVILLVIGVYGAPIDEFSIGTILYITAGGSFAGLVFASPRSKPKKYVDDNVSYSRTHKGDPGFDDGSAEGRALYGHHCTSHSDSRWD